jgi:hypothetical protein
MTKQTTVVRPGRFTSEADTQAHASLAELDKEISEKEQVVKKNVVVDKPDPGNMESDDEALKEEKDLSPIEHWRRRLAKAGITEEQAGQITDTILRQGYWEKEISILPGGRLKVTFRTRDAYHRQRLASSVSLSQTPDARYETQVRLELANSLVKFGDKSLPYPTPKADVKEQDEAFVERLKYVDNNIPDPLQDPLRRALGVFNQQVFAAMNEGAIEGF